MLVHHLCVYLFVILSRYVLMLLPNLKFLWFCEHYVLVVAYNFLTTVNVNARYVRFSKHSTFIPRRPLRSLFSL